jgi:M6 family metalloprotease-like protein
LQSIAAPEKYYMKANRKKSGHILYAWSLIAAILAFLVTIHSSPVFAAAPGAPAITSASPVRAGASVTFTPPASDGGKPITSYTVTSIPGSLTATGTSSPIVVTGLTHGVNYTFSVTAANDDGTGPSSSVSYYNVTPRPYAPATGTINNIVVFIRFSDSPEYSRHLSYYESIYNTASDSLKSFFLENSYNTLTVNSYLYPGSGDTIISYQDPHPAAYYEAYNSDTNPIGYVGAEGTAREAALVANALSSIDAMVPEAMNIDGDGDGYIDHMSFEVYNTSINPIPVIFRSRGTYDSTMSVTFRGKKVGSYTWISSLQDEEGLYPSSLRVHEMGHSLSMPDLRENSGRYPVGNYDVMALTWPVHSGAFIKHKFTGWIDDIPEITSNGTYTLNDITQATGHSYKMSIPGSSEYLVLEYRRLVGAFESHLPGSGLCITRINENAGIWGNGDGSPYYIYYFRPDGTLSSDGAGAMFVCLSADTWHTQFNDFSNPACFLSDGSPCGISIHSIGPASGSSITFSVGPATVTHLLSGRLAYSNNGSILGATVTLSGDASGTVSVDSYGQYHFIVNRNGNYTVTPSKANHTFSPTSKTFSNVTSDQTQNFTGTNTRVTISGIVSAGGFPLSGAQVTCSGGNYPPPVTTDSSGAYSCSVSTGASYSVYVDKADYFFHTQTVNNIATDTILNFSNYTSSTTFSGNITDGSSPLAGINVNCPGANTTPTITNSSGHYSLTVTVGNGESYTITPASSMYTFSPVSRNWTWTAYWQSGYASQDFTAILNQYTITVSGAGINGGTISDGSVINATWNGSALSGTYTRAVNYGSGPYTITAETNTGVNATWSGDCDSMAGNGSGTATCTINTGVTAGKNITATFSASCNPPVWIVGASYYNTIHDAYPNVTVDDQVILMEAGDITDSPNLSGAHPVKLQGGYDCAYSTNSGVTNILGTMTISGAKVIIDKVRIK